MPAPPLRRAALASWLTLSWLAAGPSTAAAQNVPLVYVRCPRTVETIEVTGEVTVGGTTSTVTRPIRGWDAYDVLPDVVNFYGDFTGPCDLMLHEPGVGERVLYDCTSTSSDDAACAAMDPAVSFDGRTIAFAVFRGTLRQETVSIPRRMLEPRDEVGGYVGDYTRPNRIMRTTEAQLHLLDVATGTTTPLPHTPGTFDAGPAFLSDGRIAFTSDRSRISSTRVMGATVNGLSSQIWTMDGDGRNVDLASHHALASDQHPLQLVDGRVAFSSWQIFGARAFSSDNGSVGGFGTISNKFALFVQNPDGANPFALYGQHTGRSALPHIRQDGSESSIHLPATIVPHFIAQTHDGRVWSADYYRGNNNALGAVFGFTPEPEGREGLGYDEVPSDWDGPQSGDLFRPRDQVTLALWAINQDLSARAMPEPAYRTPGYDTDFIWAGKLGHPTAVPPRDENDPGLVVVWGKGPCSTVAHNIALPEPRPPITSGSSPVVAANLVNSLGPDNDNPACDTGIYRAPITPLDHPNELERIVDEVEWHEFQARAVVPYRDIFGVDQPADVPRADRASSHSMLEVGTPFSLIGAASMLFRETRPFHGYHFEGKSQFGRQGTDTFEWQDEDLCGVRFLTIQPNREGSGRTYDVTGERVVVLGEVPVRNPGVTDGRGQPDTSFLLRMPANAPYMMQAIDCDGRTLNTDQTWQSTRPGETKTCGGCHVHSQEGLPFESSFAGRPDYVPARLGEGTTPLFAGESGTAGMPDVTEREGFGVSFTYENDVAPIFERRCVSCHGGAGAAAGLRLDQNTTPERLSGRMTDWSYYCLVRDRYQDCVPDPLQHRMSRGSPTTLARPQLTRYIRFMSSRASLLYWKAANARTDRRSDADFGPDDGYDHDIDFGADHPTDITPEELRTLARWIDTGCAVGPGATADTLYPTLHLAAETEGDAVTALRVGTVDLPSGIDPSTLVVCMVQPDGACGPDLSGDAAEAGVVTVSLASPLTDRDAEVRAEVADRAGNVTRVQRTVGYLLSSPPPPPPPPPAGDGGTTTLPDGRVVSVDGGPGSGPGPDVVVSDCACRAGGPSRGAPMGLLLLCLALAPIALRSRRRS